MYYIIEEIRKCEQNLLKKNTEKNIKETAIATAKKRRCRSVLTGSRFEFSALLLRLSDTSGRGNVNRFSDSKIQVRIIGYLNFRIGLPTSGNQTELQNNDNCLTFTRADIFVAVSIVMITHKRGDQTSLIVAHRVPSPQKAFRIISLMVYICTMW